ncbi:nitroreductase family protein [Mycobacterium sp. Aquia_213]|uniref:nitroreductase family protein n=1 Tax=Mycobacterium sp. Aquia_213 TaxID=2991728 RepID=UPI002270035A|nr:nitroreductase family protein [Mycobacterium sp. Aquia_213]WAC92228.1 nitroreductase family protein [Mycobacterium sp. Aquia_213]
MVDIDELLPVTRAQPPQHSFIDVLSRRRSIRSYGPLTAASLARLLDLVFALQWSAPADDGGMRRFRPVPSAGARHPLAPLILIEKVVSLDAGLWRFDPDARQLHLVTNICDSLTRPWQAACDAGTLETRPPAIIVLAAKFDATLARYPAGSALVWRDAGVALGTLHLAATDLGLASCILGTAGILDGDLLEACGVIGNLVGDVGSLALGGS